MKIVYLQILLIMCVGSPSLLGTQNPEKIKKQKALPSRHQQREPRYHRHSAQEWRAHRRPKDVMLEDYNQEQQSLYNEIHDLQRNIRKNMYALGQERRSIKNLMTSEARKRSQENINRICNEMKQQLEEHQPRIIEAIDTLP